jgi:hypothetical protein
MKEMLFFLSIIFLSGFFLSSCKKNENNPIAINSFGNIYISTIPVSAHIWLDGTDTKKITPDSITTIKVGPHTIILKSDDYLDDTILVNIQDGSRIILNRTLLSDNSISEYGLIQIWNTPGTTGFPSGIILKTGRSSLIESGGKDSVDFFYSSNGSILSTPSNSINNRSTSFFVGLSADLNDSVDSPIVLDSWAKQVKFSETNYFFLFDSDFHYSKMMITERDTSSSGSPAWIKVKWFYNNKPNDRRF